MIYIRIDDRLIHGQIVTAWCQALEIKKILAVDDTLAQNDMMKSIMTMGVPEVYQPQIVSMAEAIRFLQQNNFTENLLLLTRFARNLKAFLPVLPQAESINIGNCSKQAEEKYGFRGHGVGNVLSFTEEDYQTLEELEKQGQKVVFQQMPKDKAVDWKTIKQYF